MMKTVSERALYRIRRVPPIGHATYMTVKSALTRGESALFHVNIWYSRHASRLIRIAD
jgi:hypothetical protein